MKIVPELLAPAGSPEALKVAIESGADAIYLSGKKFGARQYAANFGIQQIQEAIDYAHLRGVKIYVTVNTLIKESEILSLAKYLLKLYEIGADAILVQDVGVATLAQYLVPELDIHASTQMTLHHEDGLKWAKSMGFKRVVLSRELSLDEIHKMSRSDLELGDLELEIFLHGALCYCYSGQCLLSSFIGGRSGNRGMCAQPCRKPYHLVVGEKDIYGKPQNLKIIPLKDEYLISPKDLSLFKNLDVLVDSGVKSLKIEGRMRSPEYVATVVKIYRNALDHIAQRTWKHSIKDQETLQMTFNRGFTAGHLLKATGKELMGRNKPGHRGLYLGKVIKYNSKNKTAEIEVNTIHKPETGDGLYLETSSPNNSQGLDIDKAPIFRKNKMFISLKRPIPAGTKVYLTRRKKLTAQTKNIRTGYGKELIKIDLSFKLDEKNHPLLEGQWKIPNLGKNEIKNEIKTTTVRGPAPMENAINRPLTAEQIQKQLVKTGDKPFKVKFINFEYPGGLFSPIKDLNQLRRNLMDKIEVMTLESYRPSTKSIEKSKNRLNKLQVQQETNYPEGNENNQYPSKSDYVDEITAKQINLSVYINNITNLKSALESGVKRVYFEPAIPTQFEILEKCYFSSLNKPTKAKKNKSKTTPPKSALNEEIANLLIEAQKLCAEQEAQFVWKWPNITQHPLLNNLKEIYEMVYDKSSIYLDVMVGSHGIAPNLKKINPSISVFGASSLNIWNNCTIDKLNEDYHLLTLSPELSRENLKDLLKKPISDTKLELLVQGNLESLISNDCLISSDLIPEKQINQLKNNAFWGLEDAKKRVFPLRISPECETILLNSVEICLVDYLDELLSMGIFNLVIDARDRTPQYIKEMTEYYFKGIEYGLINSKSDPSHKNAKKINKIKNKIKKISLGGITSSNFLKGVEKTNKQK